MAYDYFYNQEPEQYVHYQMPTILFEDERLNKLSINAKFLYCLLLDRAKLSYKNGWLDEDGKVYIQFAQADLVRLLNCGRTKMSEYFGELDETKGGVGLIERKQKNGIGKSDVIYVKNFAKSLDEEYKSDDTATESAYNYFHDMGSMRFSHYQIPKMLFVDENIKGISNTAKMAYSFLLDRSMLSYKNGWKDKDGRIYVQYPQKELQKMLGCSIRTVKSALSELDINSGVGLIDRTRQGMNSPDLIYVLDYASKLKYNRNESAEKQDPDNNVNIGGAKSEHREVQNLNIGGAKSEHREVQNLNIGSANSEHHIYNNTNSNNTNLSNTQSVSLTAVPFSGKQKIDRLTDIKSERKQFSNVLTSIGIHYEDKISHEPQNEQDFQYCDENDRNTQSCTIPYTLKSDKAAMQETLKYLFAYSFNTAEMSKETKNLLTEVISTLSAMTETDIQEYQGERVRYSDVIDRINIIIHNSYLIDWFFSFEEKWKQILSDKKIKYQRAYMKSCIWNWLKDYQFEEDNQTRLLDYEFNPKSREQQFEQEYACMLNNF